VFEDDLLYYESEAAYLNNLPPRGMVSLDIFHVIQKVNSNQSDATNKEFEFVILAVHHELRCRADSEIEMLSWINTLNNFKEIS